MKNYIVCVCAMCIPVFLLNNCATVIPVEPVEVIGAKHIQGGKRVTKPVTYDGTTVIGVPGEGKESCAAVIYQDEKDKFVTDYSNINIVKESHIKMVRLHGSKYLQLAIWRGFHYEESLGCLIMEFVLAIPTFGMSLMYPTEGYAEDIYLEQYAPGDISGRFDKCSMNFAEGNDVDVVIKVRNVGNMDVKRPFIIIDTLPDYMLFKNAKYYASDGVAKVTFDNHMVGKNQNLVFKVYPNERGISEGGYVEIKISTTPDLPKFINEYKYQN